MRKLFLLTFTLASYLSFAQQIVIDVGSSANDGTGDPLRTAFQSTNSNFTELYTQAVRSATASGTNTYTAVPDPPASLTNGQSALITFTNANTGTSTLNLNSLGAKTLKKWSSGSQANLVSGDIPAGSQWLVTYDAANTVYQISVPPSSGGSVTTTAPLTGTTTIGITQATTSTNGYLSSTDWNTFSSGSSNITTLGTITTGTWHGSGIAATYGGTGQSSVAQGDVLVGSATPNTWSKVNIGGNGTVFTSNGTTASWQTPSTGFSDPLTTNGDIIARVSGSTTRLAQGSNGTFLGVSGGALGYYSPSGSGTVNSGTTNNMAFYSSTGTAVSGTTTIPSTITWNGVPISSSYGGDGLTSLGTAQQQKRVNAGGTAMEYFTPTFNPLTTLGDLLIGGTVTSGVAAPIRLAIGGANTVLHGGSTTPVYSSLVESDFGFTDITTANVSITKHGLAPKLPNDATKYLDGTGNYTAPSIGGTAWAASGSTTITTPTITGDPTFVGSMLINPASSSNPLIVQSGSVNKLVVAANGNITAGGNVAANGGFHTTTNSSIGHSGTAVYVDATASAGVINFRTNAIANTALQMQADGDLSTTHDLIIDTSSKGLVLKDSQGTPHYWRITISTVGVLTTTDLGTTAP